MASGMGQLYLYDGSIRLADGRDFATVMLAAGQAVRKDWK
jgi:hypothetical protein